MQNFTIPARLMMAANLYKSKKDVRYYLLGVCLEKDHIVGTDGHTLFFSKLEAELPIDGTLIINTIGTIPSKSQTMDFVFSESGKEGHAVCKDGLFRTLGMVYFQVIEGKYPDWRKVCDRSNPVNTPVIGVACNYLERLSKCVKLVGNSKFPYAALNLFSNSRSMIFDINGPEFKSTVIIMPVRL